MKSFLCNTRYLYIVGSDLYFSSTQCIVACPLERVKRIKRTRYNVNVLRRFPILLICLVYVLVPL
jgi:hypothetical protein